jgi:hypothetical protein
VQGPPEEGEGLMGWAQRFALGLTLAVIMTILSIIPLR